VNSETKFCLAHWGVALPPPVEDVLASLPDAGVCLVDHQQTSQLNPSIPTKVREKASFYFRRFHPRKRKRTARLPDKKRRADLCGCSQF
jgi:hypothetical protein